jgi:hypothetical protein
MKNLLTLIAAGLLLAQPAAEARDSRPGGSPRPQMQEHPYNKRGGAPQKPERDRFQRVEPEKRKPGRLTQEERRELHRDLDRANREIYRRR